MSAFAVAARLARREVVRRPWRSLVVMLLVVGPVVVLTGLAVMVRTEVDPLDEEFTALWGDADAVVYSDAPDPEGAVAPGAPVPGSPLDGLLPEGTREVPFREAWVRVKTDAAQRDWTEVTDLSIVDPAVESTVDEVEGRLPRGDHEVLLSTALAERLELGIGDELVLERPVAHTATVVGTATWRHDLSRHAVLVDAESTSSLLDLLGGHQLVGVSHRQLVTLPDGHVPGPQLLDALQRGGIENRFVDPWSEGAGDGAQVVIVWSWVGGAVAFVIVGVVIAAAFAVTARRQLQLLGQLMGNGAGESTLRATLFLQGSVIGIVGGLVGIGIALAALEVGRPLVERLVDHRIGGYEVRPGDLFPIVLLATVAATVAALIPARTAVRTSVLDALAGRRPVGPYPNRLVLRGAVAAAGGLVLLAVATAGSTNGGTGTWLFVLTGIAGALAVILGTCAMSPAIISRLEPLATHLRGTARLAARSVARQRSRTGAIVAAIAVVAAGAVAASTVWLSALAADQQAVGWEMPDDLVVVDRRTETVDAEGLWTSERRPVDDATLAELLEIVPGATVVQARSAAVPRGGTWNRGGDPFPPRDVVGEPFLVVDPDTAAAIRVPDHVQDALDRRGFVTYGWGPDGEDLTEPEDRPVDVVHPDGGSFADGVMMTVVEGRDLRFGPMATADAAESLGLELGPGLALLVTPEPLTDDQRDALGDLRDDVSSTTGVTEGATQSWDAVWVDFHQPTWQPSSALVTTGIVAVATIFALGVVALGLSLSAAETKDERDVLAAIGARPTTLRRLAAAKAAVLATVGAAVGVPLGFVPTLVVVRAANAGDPYSVVPVVFPWVQIGLLVLAVPVVASIATLVASGVSLRVRPVQASSMAFD